jgi:hypothetical protein
MRAANVGFTTDAMGEEALRIIVKTNNIAIAGGRPRGTLYGVYTFLEDYLGIRFLTPDHTHIPPLGKTRPLASVDRTYDPPIVFRWSYWYAVNQNPDFAAHIRCNAVAKDRADLGGVSKYQLINHSLHRYICTKDYGAQHPEYFALVDGKRRVDVNGGDSYYYGTQLCMSNPDVIQIITDKVLSQLRANPAISLVQLGQGDNTYYCRCDKCAAIDKREGTHMGALLTGINQIAEAVGKEFPHVKIGTLAYSYSITPPKTLRARDNVIIELCNIGASVTKPLTDLTSARNAEFARDLKGWRERASHIAIWTYATNFHEFLLPTPSLHIWGPNIRLYHDNGIDQMFVQGNSQSPGGAFADLTNYVISRLLWDPTLNGDALIDEFLNLQYGRAAAPIRRYLNLRFNTYKSKNLDQYCNGSAEQFGIDKSIVQAGLDAAREAMGLAESDAVKERLELFSLWMYRAAMDDAWVVMNNRGKPARAANESIPDWLERVGLARGAVDPEVRRRTRPYIREMFRLIEKHKVTRWRENMPVSLADQILRHGFGLDAKEPW